MSDRLTDEQVQIVVDSRGIANDAWVYFLAREVQQWRALDLTERLESIDTRLDEVHNVPSSVLDDLDQLIVELQELTK